MIVLSSGTSCESASGTFFSFRASFEGGVFELQTWRVYSPERMTRRLTAARKSLPAGSCSWDWRDVEKVVITLSDVVEIHLKSSHNQVCCGIPLETTEEHSGGGSHYWVLRCSKCGTKYSYDTYRFTLETL